MGSQASIPTLRIGDDETGKRFELLPRGNNVNQEAVGGGKAQRRRPIPPLPPGAPASLTKLVATPDTLHLETNNPPSQYQLATEAIVEFRLEASLGNENSDATLSGELRLGALTPDQTQNTPSTIRFTFRVDELNTDWEWTDLAKRIGSVVGLTSFRVNEERIELVRRAPQIIGNPYRAPAAEWEAIGDLARFADYTNTKLTPEQFATSGVDEEFLAQVLKEPPSEKADPDSLFVDLGYFELTTWDLKQRIISRTPGTAAAPAEPSNWTGAILTACLFASVVTAFIGLGAWYYGSDGSWEVCVAAFVVTFVIGLFQGGGGSPASPAEPGCETIVDMVARRVTMGKVGRESPNSIEREFSFDDIWAVVFVERHASLEVRLLAPGHPTLFDWPLDSETSEGKDRLINLARGLTRQLADALARPIEVHDHNARSNLAQANEPLELQE